MEMFKKKNMIQTDGDGSSRRMKTAQP